MEWQERMENTSGKMTGRVEEKAEKAAKLRIVENKQESGGSRVQKWRDRVPKRAGSGL